MRRLPILLLALTVACSPATSPSPSPSAETVPTYTGLGLEALSAYNATFEMSFADAPDWSYHLETRTDGHAVEYRLHLEGLSAARFHPSVLSGANEKVAAGLQAGRHKLKDVAVTVAHVDPQAVLGGSPHGLCCPPPHLRLPRPASALMTALFGRRLAQKWLLVRNAQHASRLGDHRQDRVQQVAIATIVSNRAQPFRGRMMRMVYHCGVLDHQHQPFLACLSLCLFPMRCHQRCVGHVLLAKHTIGCLQSLG